MCCCGVAVMQPCKLRISIIFALGSQSNKAFERAKISLVLVVRYIYVMKTPRLLASVMCIAYPRSVSVASGVKLYIESSLLERVKLKDLLPTKTLTNN